MISLYSGYRPFCLPWWKEILNPRTYWFWMKSFIQRGRRGWADCDTWGFDGYLCEVIIPALKHLKEEKHGTPVPDDAVMDDCGQATDEEVARWEREWNSNLDKMIAGFEAAYAVIDGPPDRFYTPRSEEEIAADQKEADKYHDEHPELYQYVARHNVDFDGIKKWNAEQEIIRKEGFAVFTKWFHALWD